jgi:uncharacterized protein
MTALESAVHDFLDQKRIAVAGVSRQPGQVANVIFDRLKATGHEVFAVNPHAAEIGGGACYPNLNAIPGGIQAVVVVTPPDAALETMQECCRLGITRVWMHRAIGRGSVSAEAVRFGREHGIRVIDGACPMMYCGPVDSFHKWFRVILGWFGLLPSPPDPTPPHRHD